MYCRILFFLTLSLIAASSCSEGGRREYKTVNGFTQGTTFHIVYACNGKESLDLVIDSLLDAVDASVSIYRENSIISRINRNEACDMDSIFIDVFNRSVEMYEISNGFFDVSSAPLFEVWGFGAKEKRVVNDKMLDSLKLFVGMDKIKIVDGKIEKSDPRVQLNFNAIAQGYTSDLIAREFDRRGVKDYMIEVGGEIMCRGDNPSGEMWLVGIDCPKDGNFTPGEDLQAVLSIKDRGLATSGNYRKFIEENGERYSHTIDPKSGRPVKNSLLSATVIAKDATTADAYGTYFMVIGLEKAKEVLLKHPEIDGYLIYSEGDKFKEFKSKGVLIK